MLEGGQLVVELDMLDARRLFELRELAARQVDAQAVDEVEVPPDPAIEALDGPLRRTIGPVVEGDDRADAFLVGRRSVREPGCCRRRCK